jgi:hypothetical protein
MSDGMGERVRQDATGSTKSGVRPEDVEKLKHAASSISVPAVSLNQRVWMPTVSVPEVKAVSNDRRDRREATEVRRELARIAATATKAGVAMQAVRSVNTYVVYSADQGQEEMMDILYSKTRHEGMNEMVASVISQSLQQMVAQMMALAEHHFKRQMEVL